MGVAQLNHELEKRLGRAGVTNDQVMSGPEITYEGPGRLGVMIKGERDVEEIHVPGTFKVR